MTRRVMFLPLLACALIAVSCASPAKLAEKGDKALTQGRVEEAYNLARRSLDKDPHNAEARRVMTDAAARKDADWRRRIRAMAAEDTVAAAREVMVYDDFRAEVARYGVELPQDERFRAEQPALRQAAARVYYDLGARSMTEGRPKRAHGQFAESGHFWPGYRDVDRRIDDAWRQAVTRVVVLPYENQCGVPWLPKQLNDIANEQIARRIEGGTLRYTELVPVAEVEKVMTVAQLGRVTPEEAARIARKVGAGRVVWGRYFGLRAETRTDTYREGIYRRVQGRDDQGNPVATWIPVELTAVWRERDVRVSHEFRVLSVGSGAALGGGGAEIPLVARTYFTNFVPEGEPGDYALLPPDLRASDPARAKKADESWKQRFGDKTTLSGLLTLSRGGKERTKYKPEFRTQFYPGQPGPVFLDDLPPADDVAFAALMRSWEPVLAELNRLDAVDDPDAGPVARR